jgi:hypothetical protein
LVDAIHDSKVTMTTGGKPTYASVVYNCWRKGDAIRFVPELTSRQQKRELTKSLIKREAVLTGVFLQAQ